MNRTIILLKFNNHEITINFYACNKIIFKYELNLIKMLLLKNKLIISKPIGFTNLYFRFIYLIELVEFIQN